MHVRLSSWQSEVMIRFSPNKESSNVLKLIKKHSLPALLATGKNKLTTLEFFSSLFAVFAVAVLFRWSDFVAGCCGWG